MNQGPLVTKWQWLDLNRIHMASGLQVTSALIGGWRSSKALSSKCNEKWSGEFPAGYVGLRQWLAGLSPASAFALSLLQHHFLFCHFMYVLRSSLCIHIRICPFSQRLSVFSTHPIQKKCLTFLFTASPEGSSHGTQTLKGQASAYPAPSQHVLHVTAVLLQAALCWIRLFFNMQILDKGSQPCKIFPSHSERRGKPANLFPPYPPRQHPWNSRTTKCKHTSSIFWTTKTASDLLGSWSHEREHHAPLSLSFIPCSSDYWTYWLPAQLCAELPHHRVWARSWKDSAPQQEGDADRLGSYNTQCK